MVNRTNQFLLPLFLSGRKVFCLWLELIQYLKAIVLKWHLPQKMLLRVFPDILKTADWKNAGILVKFYSKSSQISMFASAVLTS